MSEDTRTEDTLRAEIATLKAVNNGARAELDQIITWVAWRLSEPPLPPYCRGKVDALRK